MIAEAQHLEVIYFAQCRVDWQSESFIQWFPVSECGVACRVYFDVERMSIAYEGLLLVRQIGNGCI